MKVKNIMFSGIMAAILGATAANAADSTPVQLISKKYADRELQAKLTQAKNAGENIAIDENGKISATGLVTTGTYTEKVGALEAKDTELVGKIEEKLDKATYEEKIAEIEGVLDGDAAGSVKKQIADAIASEVERADATYATEADLTTAEGRIGVLEQTANALGTTYASKTYEAKVDDNTRDIATIKGEQTTQNNKITALEGQLGEGGATAQAIAAAQDAANAAQADVDAVEKSLTDNNTIAKANAAAVKTEVNAALDLKANAADVYAKEAADAKFIDTAEIQNYATDAELADVKATAEAAQTAQEVADAIDGKISALKLSETYDAKGAAADAESAAKTYADGLNTAMNARVGVLEAIDHTKFAEKTTVEAIDGRLTTAEGDIEALQQASSTYATKAEITEAQYMSGKGQLAGQYVVNFDGNGNATYTAITIVD